MRELPLFWIFQLLYIRLAQLQELRVLFFFPSTPALPVSPRTPLATVAIVCLNTYVVPGYPVNMAKKKKIRKNTVVYKLKQKEVKTTLRFSDFLYEYCTINYISVARVHLIPRCQHSRRILSPRTPPTAGIGEESGRGCMFHSMYR